MYKLIFIIASLLLNLNQGLGQKSLLLKRHELEVNVGASKYYGDIGETNNLNFKSFGSTIGIRYSYNINKYISLSTGISRSQISATDKLSNNKEKKIRNLDFKSKVDEFYATLNFGTPIINSVKHPTKKFLGYIETYFGYGYFTFNPLGSYDNMWHELQPLGTEGQGLPSYPAHYNLFSTEIVYGVRLKYFLTSSINIGLEYSMRSIFTDYLDDVSTIYPNLNELGKQNGYLAQSLSDKSEELLVDRSGQIRGNPDENDTFQLFKISLGIGFGNITVYKKKTSGLPCYKF